MAGYMNAMNAFAQPWSPTPSSSPFSNFPALPSDMQIMIISFLAEAPFEYFVGGRLPYRQGSLTHTFPFVSKAFREYCESDMLWSEVISRKRRKSVSIEESSLMDPNFLTVYDRTAKQHLTMRASTSKAKHVNVKALYIASQKSLRFTLPTFFMPSTLRIDTPMRMHLFEPRYRLLIERVMRGCRTDGYPLSSDNGPRPRFIYTPDVRVEEGNTSVVVEVLQCYIHPSKQADVVLLPIEHFIIESAYVEEGTGGLHYVKGRLLGVPRKKYLKCVVEEGGEPEWRWMMYPQNGPQNGEQLSTEGSLTEGSSTEGQALNESLVE
jgi:hypothetical protein